MPYLDGFDYPAIHEQARHVIHNTKRLKKSAVEKYMKYFETRCAGSKRTVADACNSIPGGVQHNLANNYPFALNCIKSEGPYLYDVDGNRYIDFLQAGGPTILGNNYPPVTEAVIKTLRTTGHLTGLYGDFERQLADKVKQNFPSVDLFRMLASGTEACMIAIRLARGFTNRNNLIKIKGCYHGFTDQLMYEIRHIGSGFTAAAGVPDECYKYISGVMPNDIADLERQFVENEKNGGTAAFVMESIGQDSGALPLTKEYNLRARELCDKYGALLVYDEVVTAFRLGMGGAQAFYGIRPDITIFGKIIAGGYPGAGGVGGRKDVMSLLTSGLTMGHSRKVMVGGTLTANPLSCVAGYTAISEMERIGAHARLAEASDAFTHKVASLADKYGIPALVFNQGSILHIDLCGLQHIYSFLEYSEEDKKAWTATATQAMLEYAMAMCAEGIIVAGGNKTYLNLQTLGVLDEALAGIERVFQQYE